MVDAILDRLLPLGLAVRLDAGSGRLAVWARCLLALWGLHAMLVEAMLDLAGLDYDAPDRRLTLRPRSPRHGRTSA